MYRARDPAGRGGVPAEREDAPALEARHVRRQVLIGGNGRKGALPLDEASLPGERPAVDRVVDGAPQLRAREQRAARVQREEGERQPRVDEVALAARGGGRAAGPEARCECRVAFRRESGSGVVGEACLDPGNALRGRRTERVDDRLEAVRPAPPVVRVPFQDELSMGDVGVDEVRAGGRDDVLALEVDRSVPRDCAEERRCDPGREAPRRLDQLDGEPVASSSHTGDVIRLASQVGDLTDDVVDEEGSR